MRRLLEKLVGRVLVRHGLLAWVSGPNRRLHTAAALAAYEAGVGLVAIGVVRR